MENMKENVDEGMNAKFEDPVCGMSLGPQEVQVTLDYEGKAYHFCSKNCADEFEKDPKKYVEGKGQNSHSEMRKHGMPKGSKNMKGGMMGMGMRKGGCKGMGTMKSGMMGNMSNDQTNSESKANGALEILKERYAKGEITRQEYEEMKKTIAEG